MRLFFARAHTHEAVSCSGGRNEGMLSKKEKNEATQKVFRFPIRVVPREPNMIDCPDKQEGAEKYKSQLPEMHRVLLSSLVLILLHHPYVVHSVYFQLSLGKLDISIRSCYNERFSSTAPVSR